MPSCLVAPAFVLTLTLSLTAYVIAQAPSKPEFARAILPILSNSCQRCHGAEVQMGELRMDSREALLRGGTSGPAIVPSNGQGSLLVRRVLGLDDKPRMPLQGSPLTPEQTKAVQLWIDSGAPWPEGVSPEVTQLARHWAYVKPVRSEAPQVRNRQWVRNPIDAFVLAKLEKEGLSPSPEAPRETLIRRASLDLIGLPPDLKEVESFLANPSPDAYEKLVDRLLASPHFGERWARPWLDLARYGDTNGHEKDRRRSIWKYRDWVIDAFNKDIGFDRFTIEQIAGDMLPNPTLEQRIATGFHRNTLFNEEAGVDPEEDLWHNVVDRVGTTATVWLGSTLACAQCHDHKYDPFTQKDFYRLFAFFNNSEYAVKGEPGGSSTRFIEPVLELPTPEQEARRGAILPQVSQLKDTLKRWTPELRADQLQWEKQVTESQADWTILRPESVASTGGSRLEVLADSSVLASGENPLADNYVLEARTESQNLSGLRLEVLPHQRLPKGGPGRDPHGNFILNSIRVEVTPAEHPGRWETVPFREAGADDFYKEFMTDLDPRNLLKTESQGWGIDVSKEEQRLARQLVLAPEQPFGFAGGTRMRITLRHHSADGRQSLGCFRLWVTGSAAPLDLVRITAKLRPVLSLAEAKRTADQRRQLAEYFLSVAPALQPIRDRLQMLERELKELGIVDTLVMQERAGFERPATFLRVRGSFINKGEKEFAGVPGALHPLPSDQMPNRLGLARWLVDENNPLTARVMVNRFWEQIFGRGIVETSEDFGTQGSLPAHPELLDWLATEFRQQKWSVKRLLRLIVTSATYRQSSRVTPELLEKDPDNKRLARGPRFRMEGEMMRDAALAASGLLSRKIGGPSVFPHQPEGIWDIPYNLDQWRMSAGEDRYRRGLYTFWRRTSPYPSLMTFDATSREFCTVRRIRTNTPLQALTLLNDPAFFEMSRGLARRIVEEGGDSVESRIRYGFRVCVARQPRPEELGELTRQFNRQQGRFEKDGAAARSVVAESPWAKRREAEAAAWTVVANVLLNLDETITKE